MRFTLTGALILLLCSRNPIRSPLKDEPLDVRRLSVSSGNVVFRGDILRLPTASQGARSPSSPTNPCAVYLNRDGAWEM